MLKNEVRQEATFAKEEAKADGKSVNPGRRVHTRFSVDVDVSMGSDHNFYNGFAENLSAGGIFIATHTEKKIGEILEISINLPAIETPVRGVGEVRWVRVYSESSNVPPGLGLRFISLEEGSEEAIAEFLANREPLFYDDE